MSERCPACGLHDCARECPIGRGAVSRAVYDEIAARYVSRLSSAELSRDSFRDAYEKAHAGERHEIRLNDDGSLDEIVGHGRFHLEQMNENEWFLEVAGFALWINGKKVRLVPRDHNTWQDAKAAAVERRVVDAPQVAEASAAAPLETKHTAGMPEELDVGGSNPPLPITLKAAQFQSLLDTWMRDDAEEQARTLDAIEAAGLLRF